MATITYECPDRGILIQIQADEFATTYDFIDDVVYPLMCTVGYIPDQVAQALNMIEEIPDEQK